MTLLDEIVALLQSHHLARDVRIINYDVTLHWKNFKSQKTNYK